AAKMMFDWLGEKYNDQSCLRAAWLVENGVISALKKNLSVADLGGKLKTDEMAEVIANEIAEIKI
ncbi:MAG: isocitrate/isopropylmalate dehydrogenase family protein, partial [Candidatus Bathyarchaeia archaeon]